MQPTKSAQPFSRVFPKFYQVKHVFIIPASEPDQHPASFSGLPSAELVAILVRLPSRSERREETREVDAGDLTPWEGWGLLGGLCFTRESFP